MGHTCWYCLLLFQGGVSVTDDRPCKAGQGAASVAAPILAGVLQRGALLAGGSCAPKRTTPHG